VIKVSFPFVDVPESLQGKAADLDIPLEDDPLCSKGTLESKFDDSGVGFVLVEESSHFLQTFAKSCLEEIIFDPISCT
jgi:hypothetical protein